MRNSAFTSKRCVVKAFLLLYASNFIRLSLRFTVPEVPVDLPLNVLEASKPPNCNGVKRAAHFADILPILPTAARNSSSNRTGPKKEALRSLFHRTDKYGWIDVVALPWKSVPKMRASAETIMGRNVTCAYSKVERDGQRLPTDDLEFCMWSRDIVSNKSLDNFSFEKNHWMWAARAFENLHSRYPDMLKDPCQSLGFLDIGANVGDWISPIRLLAPNVPMYGIEGSPSTAAIAAANFRTAVECHNLHLVSRNVPSKILPFALTNWGHLEALEDFGGMCFSRPTFSRKTNAVNIGGRRAEYRKECPVVDSAGATTLEHALQGMIPSACPNHNWPSIYIIKIDVEGHEFKAISSAISWLSENPPCYVVIEYWKHNSYVALVELLLDVGYNALWKPKDGNYPLDSKPWWTAARGVDLQTQLKKSVGTYTELIFGTVDNDSCIRRLLR